MEERYREERDLIQYWGEIHANWSLWQNVTCTLIWVFVGSGDSEEGTYPGMWTFLYSVHCLESGHIFKCILFSCKNFNSSPTIFFFFCFLCFCGLLYLPLSLLPPPLVTTPDFRVGKALLSTFPYWPFEEFIANVYRQKDPLEQEMATHSSILAWRIPWAEKPGGLQSMESQRIRHD